MRQRPEPISLTGMGKDASAGAAAVKRAGGVVLVQSEETAEQPSMPRAAIARGASDLVLPLHEIGMARKSVSDRGSSRPSPMKCPVATNNKFLWAGVSARRLNASRVVLVPRPPIRATTSGTSLPSFFASDAT